MKIGVSFLILFMLMLSKGYGVEYYVSKAGSDSNPGTTDLPWKTIQKAANTLAAGDIVYIKAGTYKERVIPKNPGSAGKYITYTAFANDMVIIDGSGIQLPDDWGGLVDLSNKNYIKISGLRIKNAGPHMNNQGLLVDTCSYIIIENNYTYNTVSSGIGAWNSNHITIDGNEVVLACNDGAQECITVAVTSNFEIKNNHVHDGGPGTNGAEGIDAKDGSSNGKIYNNHVHDMNRLGIYVDAWDKHTYNIEIFDNIVHDINGHDCYTLASESGGLLERVTVYNNIGYHAGENGLTLSLNGLVPVQPMKDITIINNTFYNNGSGIWGGGIVVGNPDVRNVVIRNNILSQNLTYQMEIEPNVPKKQLTVDHNLIHGFRDYVDEIKGNDYVEGNPLFVDAAGADFHIKENSPAIDTGSSTSAPAKDFEGNTRPQGNGFDIGAYEYVISVSPMAEIALSRIEIYIAALEGSTTQVTGTFTISNSGTGAMDWSITDNAAWLTINPSSGSNTGVVTVSADPSGLIAGGYLGTITVSSAQATNSPQILVVHFTIINPSLDQAPFGQFDSPIDGSTVYSSIPVTGWALDDVAAVSVKIERDPVSGEGSNRIYIGDALFVEGARSDIQVLYPSYPNSSEAGWGYMMLTNFLPNGGNGTFTLYATAADNAGHEILLGTKTIMVDNANAVKPFGAIDTPTQGGIASGKNFRNWGWVLTPQPNHIPTDGSTITVWVDGLSVGHPKYNIYRSDIAALFPGYANSKGAVGYFDLDTTAYANGVHTIFWTAADAAGNLEGIGARYFTIQNPGDSSSLDHSSAFGVQDLRFYGEGYKPLPVP